MFVNMIAAAVMSGSLITPSAGINICGELDKSPDFDGIVVVGTAMMNQGFTPDQAAEMLVYSVNKNCPEYLPLLFEFADTYGG